MIAGVVPDDNGLTALRQVVTGQLGVRPLLILGHE